MDRLPPLRLLTMFDAVARLGSMREAALRLNVTQPAVTQALKQLEDHVGATLFDRGTRPATLTEAGQILARAARDGLDIIGNAIEEIRDHAGSQDQWVTVSCTLGMATYWLMPRLPDFYTQHPEMLVNVQAPPTDLPNIAPGIDIALRYGKGGWRDGETVKLFNEIIRPVGRPELVAQLLAAGTGLEGAPLINVRSPEARHWAGWSDYFAIARLGRHHAARQTFDNYVQAVQAALDGRGLMLGWRSITAGLVAEGALAEWPDGAVDFGTGYHATLSARGAERPATRLFLDWLVQHAQAVNG